jgi:hypothetical protein
MPQEIHLVLRLRFDDCFRRSASYIDKLHPKTTFFWFTWKTKVVLFALIKLNELGTRLIVLLSCQT